MEDLEKSHLSAPNTFEFPFTPYKIQQDFMASLYDAIENRKLAVFESPTGTGKTMSIICGAVRWLKDHEKREKDYLESLVQNFDTLLLKCQQDEEQVSNDWITLQAKRLKIRDQKNGIQHQLHQLKLHDDFIRNIRSKKSFHDRHSATKLKQGVVEKDKVNSLTDQHESDDDLMIEDDLLPHVDDDLDPDQKTEDESTKLTQILICSRTHSQLAQFVQEFQRTSHALDTRVVILSSRQNYCVNESVRKLKNIALINERCCDLVSGNLKKDKQSLGTKKSKTTSSCPYLPYTEDIHDSILRKVQDIESLVSEGQKIKGCPYYGSKKALKNAQIVLMPYNNLLHKPTRLSNEISVKDNVIIIDEAHNLLEALENMYSSELSKEHLKHALDQLECYRDKFSKRFSTKTLINLNQLIFFVRKILITFDNKSVTNDVLNVENLLSEANVDNLNFFEILDFCKNTKLAQKLHGFSLKYNETSSVAISNPLVNVFNFLDAINNRVPDSRVMFTKSTQGSFSLKYFILNAAEYFRDLVHEARAIILAGGTMKPYQEFNDRLFKPCTTDVDRLMTFSCKHVVPSQNIACVVLNQGPTGQKFRFSYETRESNEMISELGRVLSNICNVVRGGIVCFFTSYFYENLVYQLLENSKTLTQIRKKKCIFREPKEASSVDMVLKQYSACIEKCSKQQTTETGALLFSVAGGKLSEGLNFNDDLGRCIVMIGMPYGNLKSIELCEKMNFLNEIDRSFGRLYYENVCMRVVNQCIGRAIRHVNDYACLVLLDERFGQQNVQNLLPNWILDSMKICDKFSIAFSTIISFFACKTKH